MTQIPPSEIQQINQRLTTRQQQEYQEALNEIFAHDAELYNYIMYYEEDYLPEFDLDALEERMYLTEDNKGEDMASKTDLIETKHVDTENMNGLLTSLARKF